MILFKSDFFLWEQLGFEIKLSFMTKVQILLVVYVEDKPNLNFETKAMFLVNRFFKIIFFVFLVFLEMAILLWEWTYFLKTQELENRKRIVIWENSGLHSPVLENSCLDFMLICMHGEKRFRDSGWLHFYVEIRISSSLVIRSDLLPANS